MTILQQAQQGFLICPKTKSPLSLDGGELVSTAGARYPIFNGVPILIDDATQREYLAQNQGGMATEYESQTSSRTPRRGLRKVVSRWLNLHDDYRSTQSIKAYHDAIASQPDDALILSVGGGPQPNPKATNINIAPFPNVDVVADAYALPYADKVADAVLCEAVLEHLEFPDQAAFEMARVLKPGGQLFAATPFLQGYHGYPNHFQNFTLTGHERLFMRQGLEIVASGVCVGPSFMLSQLMQSYSLIFCRRRISARAILVLAALFRKRDRRANQHPGAASFASTTFVHARKLLETQTPPQAGSTP